MKTDSLFYRIFQEIPQTFFELIGQTPNLVNQYRFDSVEVKQTSFRIDGVFLPQTEELPIYFTEVQFQKDPELYARLFGELFLYLRHHNSQRPWRVVIILRSRSVEPSEADRRPYEPLLNSSWVTRIYLKEWTQQEISELNLKILQLILSRKRQVTERVRELNEQIESEIPTERNRLKVLDLIERVVLYKLPKISQQELETMFSVEDLKNTRFAQELKAEGREEGREETTHQVILRLFAKGMPVSDIAEIVALEVERVQQVLNSQSN